MIIGEVILKPIPVGNKYCGISPLGQISTLVVVLVLFCNPLLTLRDSKTSHFSKITLRVKSQTHSLNVDNSATTKMKYLQYEVNLSSYEQNAVVEFQVSDVSSRNLQSKINKILKT